MGNGDRSAFVNLLLEERNHTTITTEHIAKPRGDELSYTLHLSLNDSLIERLAINLTDAL